MLFAEGVKCSSFHKQILDRFEWYTAFLLTSQCEHTLCTHALKIEVFSAELGDLEDIYGLSSNGAATGEYRCH